MPGTTEVPLYATQGGGIATSKDGQFVWHELPDWVEALPDGEPNKQKVGDLIPDEWDIVPINESARQEMSDEFDPLDFSDFSDPAGL
jgi:hypothetical protein